MPTIINNDPVKLRADADFWRTNYEQEEQKNKDLEKQIKELKAQSGKQLSSLGDMARVLSMLETVLDHTSARNGMAEKSKIFCSGCLGGRPGAPCPFPEAHSLIEELRP